MYCVFAGAYGRTTASWLSLLNFQKARNVRAVSIGRMQNGRGRQKLLHKSKYVLSWALVFRHYLHVTMGVDLTFMSIVSWRKHNICCPDVHLTQIIGTQCCLARVSAIYHNVYMSLLFHGDIVIISPWRRCWSVKLWMDRPGQSYKPPFLKNPAPSYHDKSKKVIETKEIGLPDVSRQ